ncbi:translation initiation factor IF-2 [Limibacillus halophilus]|uniref:Translation initiation factor IF-2 n=1 Tax=Limibacillus halophilus TaxID=1579333 RepID=A0A839SYA7_9PROT|nr:translation initiation factor IF-2 [Limibacillus halophilus]MBB3066536.1 translation initiation factor IF-2 [Limibacillus halophilus]
MSESKEKTPKKPLSLSGSGRLELKKTLDAGQVRQSFSHGRSKTVQVEVKRSRSAQPNPAEARAAAAKPSIELRGRRTSEETEAPTVIPEDDSHLTGQERQVRMRVVEEAKKRSEEEAKRKAEEDARRSIEEKERAKEEAKRKAEEDARRLAEEEARAELEAEAEARRKEKEAEARARGEEPQPEPVEDATPADGAEAALEVFPGETHEEATARRRRDKERPEGEDSIADLAEEMGGRVKRKAALPKAPTTRRTPDDRRRGKLTISRALEGEGEQERQRSLASLRRQREREKQRLREQMASQPARKVIREVVVPETITVQELANRMAERGGEVVKTLMKLGVMVTINQTIDADTAELVVEEFGHKLRRVSDSDVEIGMRGDPDDDSNLEPRAPVVTVMGHVDHGKTSLLDALRASDVVAQEAGGITQHIGAYQVHLASGQSITFIDTPGHAAFTEMRARGANVTDIVVLVVAADDGIMEQTVEAINHAKAAQVPIIVAINKMDKPEANPDRVKQELLSHDLVVEEMGGEIIAIPVSAKTREGLPDLEEAIQLQAEILELKANALRAAEGVVVEARLEQGRGSVATVLVQRGTLRMGDVFVTGNEWGRVRALINDRGERVEEAGPSIPVEVTGLQGTPHAGDDFVVVEDETKAREISEFRSEAKRQSDMARSGRGSLEQMLSKIKEGEIKELSVVVKSDVQGSQEAIVQALNKVGTDEARVRVLHAGVGGVNESDITLARASDAIVIAFNVRANAQARDAARRDGVDIRYYSIIYNVVDEMKAALSGLLDPEQAEKFLGYAAIREVFNITKVGKVAGCMITDGVVKRGCKVRLLRDDVVVHDGNLKTLRRFKDEVKEVKSGYECGMAFENYNDIQVGDVIECYEIEEKQREL